MTYQNSAAWLDAVGARFRIGPAESYKPGKGEVLVEISAVAINPADAAQQDAGLLIEKYPIIIGCDAAGTIVEVGEGVTRFTVGTRVLAFIHDFSSQDRAAFQKYAIAPEILLCPIPDGMSYRDACVIPVALSTAAAGLHGKDYLALPYPTASPVKTGKTVLIWSGASSVGSVAIQLAAASGVEVVTTASPRNFEYCKNLGASTVLDYNSSSVVEDTVAVLKGTDLIGAYEGKSITQDVDMFRTELLLASGMDDAMKKTSDVLSALGGGYMAATRQPIKDLPAGVTSTFINCVTNVTEDPKSTWAIWAEFMPQALKNGQIISAPPAEVVGKGLDAIQAGIDAWKKGVSAKKIVVEL